MMEAFTGNGAECMVRFVADGCKGRIVSDDSRVRSLMKKEYWDDAIYKNNDDIWGILWLAEPCVYYPPVPTYRNATAKEALCAYWIDSKDVEYQLTAMAPIEGPRKWMPITADYKAWADPYRIYRIMED